MSIDSITNQPVRSQRIGGGKKRARAPKGGAPLERERVDRATLRTHVVTDRTTLSGTPLQKVEGVQVSEQIARSLVDYVGKQIAEFGKEALGAHGPIDSSRVAALLH